MKSLFPFEYNLKRNIVLVSTIISLSSWEVYGAKKSVASTQIKSKTDISEFLAHSKGENRILGDSAAYFTSLNGQFYNEKNYLNPIIHNIYMANNRSEAQQWRINLAHLATQSSEKLVFVDLLEDQMLSWASITQSDFYNKVKKFHSIIGMDSTYFNDIDERPVILLFSSASHNLYSTAGLQVVEDLRKKGAIVAMMEYPGYGGSLGEPGKENWELASAGATRFVKGLFPRNKLFLIGHSIGANVALAAAAQESELVDGVVSHAGFLNLFEASKDSKKYFMSDLISPIATKLMASKENWNGESSLIQLVSKGKPILFLHGSEDNSVSPRHLSLFQDIYFNFSHANDFHFQEGERNLVKFSLVPNASHETFYANSNYGPYELMWHQVFDFISDSDF